MDDKWKDLGQGGSHAEEFIDTISGAVEKGVESSEIQDVWRT